MNNINRCTNCYKNYNTKGALRLHLKKCNTLLPPYHCDICEKTYLNENMHNKVTCGYFFNLKYKTNETWYDAWLKKNLEVIYKQDYAKDLNKNLEQKIIK